MVEYKDRLAQAMTAKGMTVASLAEALNITYQAVKKVYDGKSSSFNAINHAQVAQILDVSSDWLALGEGDMVRTDQAWPFSKWVPATRIQALDRDDLGFVAAKICGALDELDQRSTKSTAA